MFMREALKKICCEIPAAETLRIHPALYQFSKSRAIEKSYYSFILYHIAQKTTADIFARSAEDSAIEHRTAGEAAAGISQQYFPNMFMREALRKICCEIPAAETFRFIR